MSQAADHRKAIVKLLQANAYRHQLWDAFSDFVELAALAIANAVDLAQFDAREARYLQIVGRYEAEEVARFPKMLAELVNAMEAETGDQLGMIFGELELGNSARGQFFTPYHLCVLMAQVTVGDGAEMRARIRDRGFITLQEPACGAGAMIVAFASEMQRAGFNYQQQLHVTATDVDSRAAHMAYVQLSLMNIPAIVVLGNTLTLEQREVWFTPAHIMGAWDFRLLARATDNVDQAPVDVEPLALPSLTGIEQLDLFGMKEAA